MSTTNMRNRQKNFTNMKRNINVINRATYIMHNKGSLVKHEEKEVSWTYHVQKNPKHVGHDFLFIST